MFKVYVDSLYGSDSNNGDILSPVATLANALSKVDEGGIIVVQTGNGTSYGNISITKNISIVSAEGSSPIIGTITISQANGCIKGLRFIGISEGIRVIGNGSGVLIVRECYFENVQNPIIVNYINYVAIHRNFFFGHHEGVVVNYAKEICISSNIFSGGYRSLSIATAERVDIWRNTIYGAASVPYSIIPDYNLRVIYKILDNFDIAYKRIQLPGKAAEAIDNKYDVTFNIVNGPSFNYGVDYIVIGGGTIVSWEGLGLENRLFVGDEVRIMYSEDVDITSGEAIRLSNIGDVNSRVDSNSISGTINMSVETPIDVGVFNNTPIKIRYNNFDLVSKWWDGVAPSGGTGINNIGETALYIDANNRDFRLQPDSPNIDRGDPDRWDNILFEMGVFKIGHGYTMSYTGIRDNVAPFDNDIDYLGFYRGVTGIENIIGDIGAIEYNVNESATGNYVSEYGYDESYPGTYTAPYYTLDKGFKTATDNLYLSNNPVPVQDKNTKEYTFYETGIRYGRYIGKNVVLSDASLVVGNNSNDDLVYITFVKPNLILDNNVYVSADGNDDTGDGSVSYPYRTIQRALLDNPSVIILKPGVYSSFKGVSGVHIVGVEETNTIALSKKYINQSKNLWTGIGTYKVTYDGLKMNNANICTAFRIGNNPDVKFNMSVPDGKLYIELYNSNNKIFIEVDRLLSVIYYGYMTNSTVYHISCPVNVESAFNNIMTRIHLGVNKFTITLRNSFINIKYSNFLQAGSLTDWYLKFEMDGIASSTISELNIYSDDFVGITGINELNVYRNIFAIAGDIG